MNSFQGAYNGLPPLFRSPEEIEKQSLKKTSLMLGLALCIYAVLPYPISIGFHFLLGIATAMIPTLNTELITQVFGIFLSIISLVVPFFIYSVMIKMPLRVAFPLKKPNPKEDIPAIFVLLGAVFFGGMLSNVTAFVFSLFGLEPVMYQMDIPYSTVGRILYAVDIVLIPAIFEEYVFRGVILQSLRRYGDLFALIVSSIIFSLLHANFVQIPYTLVFGFLMGYFALKTSSLWVCMVIHFINNGMAVAFEFLAMSLSEGVMSAVNLVYDVVTLIAAVIVVIVTVANGGIIKLHKQGSVLSSGRKMLITFTSPTVIVAVAIFLYLAMTMLRVIA